MNNLSDKMKYLRKYNEDIDPFEEDDWDEEEYENDYNEVQDGYQFKKGDKVKIKKDSRFRGPVGSRKGTVINKQGKTLRGDDWWIVEWEKIEGKDYLNRSNYPTEDLLIYYENLNENFDFDFDDFDFEEEQPRTELKVGDVFEVDADGLHKKYGNWTKVLDNGHHKVDSIERESTSYGFMMCVHSMYYHVPVEFCIKVEKYL